MKITITESAKVGLFEIYIHQLDYSEKYADDFQYNIDYFIVKNLSSFPKIGHLFNKDKGLYRLIYETRYNIYYQIEEEDIFVLFIVDGPLNLNTVLLNPNIQMPSKT